MGLVIGRICVAVVAALPFRPCVVSSKVDVSESQPGVTIVSVASSGFVRECPSESYLVVYDY